MAQSPSTVMVTGAAGFIGSHLCAALVQRGRDVIGIDNFDAFYSRAEKTANIERVRAATGQGSGGGARGANFQLVEIDIRDREGMTATFARHRPASVFHLAAMAGVRPSIADPAKYASVNVDGTVSVLDAARANGCRNVVVASSSSVYGNNRKVPFAETDAVDEPISPYAATKRAGELICHTYAHLFGLRIAALRFFTAFGPAQRPDLAIASFMRKIAAGEEIPVFGDGTTSRDYTYIEDIIDGVLAAETAISDQHSAFSRSLDSQVWNPASRASGGVCRIWNLGNSHPVTLSMMIDTIARVVGKPAKVTRVPKQPGDVERTWADLTRSAAELGYQPRIAFEEGVQRQWVWLRSGDRPVRSV